MVINWLIILERNKDNVELIVTDIALHYRVTLIATFSRETRHFISYRENHHECQCGRIIAYRAY